MKKSLILLALSVLTLNLFAQVFTPAMDSCKTNNFSEYLPEQPYQNDTFIITGEIIKGKILIIDEEQGTRLVAVPFPKKVWDTSPMGIIKGINYKKTAWVAGIGLFRGFVWGTREVIHYWYSDFQRRFPNANPGFWNPDQSWTNKYKNGDEKQGEAFPLSTTALVPFTDASHLTAALNSASLVGMGIVITIGEKRPWYYYLIDAGVGFISSGIGFEIAKETLRKRN